MKFILRLLSSAFLGAYYFVFGTAIMYTALVIYTSGYEYRLVDNKVMRAWHVKLPGYEPYLDFNSKPPVYRDRFTMRKYYRVGPWFEPEFPQDEPNDANP